MPETTTKHSQPQRRFSPEDLRPTIIVDTREQAPLRFSNLSFTTGTLQSGDYSFAGAEDLFAVERKSIPDLVSCCIGDNRARFERELHRLRGFRFKRLLIVGHQIEVEQHRYRSATSPKSILSTLAAFEIRYDIPVVWATTPDDAAVLVERWVWWFAREMVKQASLLVPAQTATGNNQVSARNGPHSPRRQNANPPAVADQKPTG